MTPFSKFRRVCPAAIEARGMGAQQPAPAGHKIGAGRFDDELKTIAHKTERMDRSVGLGANLRKRREQASIFQVIPENGFAPISPRFITPVPP
jgi:hypothetical protein